MKNKGNQASLRKIYAELDSVSTIEVILRCSIPTKFRIPNDKIASQKLE